jgi:hypothetical protein
MARAGTDAVYWYMSLLFGRHRSGGSHTGRHSGDAPGQLEHRFGPFVSGTTADDMRFDELFVRDPLTAWGEWPRHAAR